MASVFFHLEKISKRFGPLVVNDQIDLIVSTGEIHGIVGENGAGKSTLMKILYGMHRPDSGVISVKGERAQFRSPSDALARGIGMVHQHFMLVDRMAAWENLALGAEPVRWGKIRKRDVHADFNHLASEIQATLKSETEVSDLSVGQQQSLEILKLLYRKSECLIFDEPTGVLTPQEVDRFLQILRRLKAAGKTIVLISHKLNEILSVCDRVTVLRAGKKIETVNATDVSPQQLARLMVGRDVKVMDECLPRTSVPKARTLIRCNNLSTKRLRNLNFEIRESEVVGVAGIEGNGQKDLAETLWGLGSENVRGELEFDGRDVRGLSVRARKELGFSYIPEDRHSDGLVLNFNLLENFYLGNEGFYGNSSIFPRARIEGDLRRAIKDFEIKASRLESPISSLSGGNQQKIIFARELLSKPKFLICAQPTRGVDVGAIERIHRELIERRNQGLSILLFSSELNELLALSDRILVMRDFSIVEEFKTLGRDWSDTRYKIGEAMICRS